MVFWMDNMYILCSKKWCKYLNMLVVVLGQNLVKLMGDLKDLGLTSVRDEMRVLDRWWLDERHKYLKGKDMESIFIRKIKCL